ncbi:response regulator transcription factor [Bosea sp. BIWAKO-01]|uniref:response regulator n=1 Tax=Bosea sp. BIWAKO-01 TaxID=506668 RepID=UPI00086B9726|nr:response regulator transcription factor [Bosea sp. BIWAKO-01]GAU86884.1 hypothetical protein BIWAKO_06832 [Bosea sp. BIWAKO-01]
MRDISIAILDDHPLLMEGIATLLKRRGGFALVATGSSAEQIISIAENHQPDAMIVDLNMPGDVFQAMAEASRAVPDMKIVIFTASHNTDDVLQALAVGASCYVLKGSPADELFEAIATARRGQTYVTPSLAANALGALSRKSLEKRAPKSVRLSVREDQIIRLLLYGKQNREIANALSLSEKTIKSYMTDLMAKLNVRNRLELVLAAQKLDPATRTPQTDERPPHR